MHCDDVDEVGAIQLRPVHYHGNCMCHVVHLFIQQSVFPQRKAIFN